MVGFSFLNVVKEVAGILNESRKLFLKNKKLMFSLFLFSLLLNSLVYLFNTFAIQPEKKKLILEASLLLTIDPDCPEYFTHLMRVFTDFRRFVSSFYIFLTVSSIITLFSTLVMVHGSALTHKDYNIKIKDFPVLTLKSWWGPLVTNFYIALFTNGYFFLFYIILFTLLLFSTTPVAFAAKALALLILFVVFQSYLAIVWNLSMVISILEETYGIQALGKAAKIVKGMKLKLFLLNLSFSLLYCGLALINLTRSFAVTLTAGLVLVSAIFAVRMFQLVTYTVAYFQCKGLQGKDVDSLRDVEYISLMGGHDIRGQVEDEADDIDGDDGDDNDIYDDDHNDGDDDDENGGHDGDGHDSEESDGHDDDGHDVDRHDEDENDGYRSDGHDDEESDGHDDDGHAVDGQEADDSDAKLFTISPGAKSVI